MRYLERIQRGFTSDDRTAAFGRPHPLSLCALARHRAEYVVRLMGRLTRQVEVEGLKQVERNLARLGWRTVETPSNSDVGTDLYADLFDDRGHSLRLQIGVQVKSGPSYFKRRKRGKDKDTEGWWYKERSKRHTDYWTTHPAAHLLVLVDVAEEVSYWVHVKPGAVKSTGKGAKILVPRSQTITSEHADALVETAARQKSAPQLQGLAFTADIDSLPLGRRLRYALMAPRLVAPLRAAGFESTICAEEAIALIAAGRFSDLKRFSEVAEDVPDPDETYGDAPWLWQFVAAFWEWATNDSLVRLRTVFESAPDWGTRAASGVLLSCAHRREESHVVSSEVLDSLVESGSLDPADHGWVLVQRARNRIDAGDLEGAGADAVQAQRSLAGDRDDITVSALTASAAWPVYFGAWMRRFESGDFASGEDEEKQNYKELLIAFDTAVSWWRSRQVSAALSVEHDESFRSWAQDDPIDEFIHGSSGEDELFAAELNADLTAQQGAWQSIAERRGVRLLMRASKSDNEQNQLAEGLDILRRCGRKKPLGDAIGHLLRVGPANALAKSLQRLPRTGWVSTSVTANFEALKLAGQFLDAEPAGELLLSCTRFARGDTADLPQSELTPAGLIIAALDGAAGLMPAASDMLHVQVARDLAELPSNLVLAYSTRIEGVLTQLRWDRVESPDRERLRDLAHLDNARATAAVLGWFSTNGDAEAHDELQRLATTGDLSAIEALDDLSVLSDAEAGGLLEALGKKSRSVLAEASRGRYPGDSGWVAHSLVRAFSKFHHLADWDEAFALLDEASVNTSTKRALCAAADRFADRLPDDIRRSFIARGVQIGQFRPIYRGDGEIGAVRSLLLYGLGALSNGEAEAALIGHATGTHLERRDASHLALAIGSSSADIVLMMLAQDKDFAVRSNAAYCVGRRVAAAENHALDAVALEIARSEATYLQLSVLNGLRAADLPRRPIAGEVAEQLGSHPSARVRRRAVALEIDATRN